MTALIAAIVGAIMGATVVILVLVNSKKKSKGLSFVISGFSALASISFFVSLFADAGFFIGLAAVAWGACCVIWFFTAKATKPESTKPDDKQKDQKPPLKGG